MELYYNYWGNELPALIQGANKDKRQLIPLTDRQNAVIDQDGNNSYCFQDILTRLIAGDSWLQLWETLQPLLIDFIKRCRATAPESATGQYLVDCCRSWCDNTTELLTRAKGWLCTQPNTDKATIQIDHLIDQCATALLLYEGQTITSYNKPLFERNTARPAPATTANYAKENCRAKALNILQYQQLQGVFDRLFDLGVFADDNGIWAFNTKSYRVWELALFIMLVDNVVNNGKGLTIADNPGGYNWRYFEGWLYYKGHPINSTTIKQRANDVLEKDANQLNNNAIYRTFLDNYTE